MPDTPYGVAGCRCWQEDWRHPDNPDGWVKASTCPYHGILPRDRTDTGVYRVVNPAFEATLRARLDEGERQLRDREPATRYEAGAGVEEPVDPEEEQGGGHHRMPQCRPGSPMCSCGQRWPCPDAEPTPVQQEIERDKQEAARAAVPDTFRVTDATGAEEAPAPDIDALDRADAAFAALHPGWGDTDDCCGDPDACCGCTCPPQEDDDLTRPIADDCGVHGTDGCIEALKDADPGGKPGSAVAFKHDCTTSGCMLGVGDDDRVVHLGDPMADTDTCGACAHYGRECLDCQHNRQEREECVGCGSGDIVYENYKGQLFCCPCAHCCTTTEKKEAQCSSASRPGQKKAGFLTRVLKKLRTR